MAEFKAAFAFVLSHEDPSGSGKVTVDAGGRTRFGIAERFHPELAEEFFSGPAEAALRQAEEIEERDYWAAMRLEELEEQRIANKLFDMGVNMGVHQAAVYAQRAANFLLAREAERAAQPVAQRLAEDGKIGEKTLAAIAEADPQEYYQALCELSEAHYRHVATVNPEQAVNLRGWLKRAQA